MYCGPAAAVIVVFFSTLAFYCNLHNKLNIHFSLFSLQLCEQRDIPATQPICNHFISHPFPPD